MCTTLRRRPQYRANHVGLQMKFSISLITFCQFLIQLQHFCYISSKAWLLVATSCSQALALMDILRMLFLERRVYIPWLSSLPHHFSSISCTWLLTLHCYMGPIFRSQGHLSMSPLLSLFLGTRQSLKFLSSIGFWSTALSLASLYSPSSPIAALKSPGCNETPLHPPVTISYSPKVPISDFLLHFKIWFQPPFIILALLFKILCAPFNPTKNSHSWKSHAAFHNSVSLFP